MCKNICAVRHGEEEFLKNNSNLVNFNFFPLIFWGDVDVCLAPPRAPMNMLTKE
jgi:hypothetical protein